MPCDADARQDQKSDEAKILKGIQSLQLEMTTQSDRSGVLVKEAVILERKADNARQSKNARHNRCKRLEPCFLPSC
ncbi:hypothetical protein WJX74_004100 [Apatococcus lobatus]|uniref:Uncharacterized protein n=1 Tax=Apatococcus lobatus TaxID=904363 RepID=A0AAW1RAL9_9CHLO